MRLIKPLKLKIVTKIKNLTEILSKTQKSLTKGDFKMASVYCSGGINECSKLHKQLNEETEGMGMKDSFNYKGKYKVQGKTLNNWMEKFWNIIEDNDLDLVYEQPIDLSSLNSIILKSGREQVTYNY